METSELSWDDLRILLAVHRHTSLLGAGRALGLSTSTTGRRLDRLEAAVGRPLVLRGASGTRLDASARPLVALAEQVELTLSATERSAGGLSGVVRLSTGDGFARALTGVLAEVRRLHPGLVVELIAETRVADIAKGEADLALRLARTASAEVVEKPLGRLTFALYASRQFVDERLGGTVVSRELLSRLEVVTHSRDQRGLPQNQWLERLGAGRVVFRSNNDEVLLEAIRRGQGLGVLATLVGEAERDLVRLEPPAPGPSVPVWLVFQRQLREAPRIRVVVEAIAAAFRATQP